MFQKFDEKYRHCAFLIILAASRFFRIIDKYMNTIISIALSSLSNI